MNEHFRIATMKIPGLFSQLLASSTFNGKGLAEHKGRAGVYVFFENGVPVHVGRTRNLAGRLRGHVTKSHFSASFAFKRTRIEQGRVMRSKILGSVGRSARSAFASICLPHSVASFLTVNDLDKGRRPARLIRTCHLSLCLRIVAIEILQLGPIRDQLRSRFLGSVEGFGLSKSDQ